MPSRRSLCDDLAAPGLFVRSASGGNLSRLALNHGSGTVDAPGPLPQLESAMLLQRGPPPPRTDQASWSTPRSPVAGAGFPATVHTCTSNQPPPGARGRRWRPWKCLPARSKRRRGCRRATPWCPPARPGLGHRRQHWVVPRRVRAGPSHHAMVAGPGCCRWASICLRVAAVSTGAASFQSDRSRPARGRIWASARVADERDEDPRHPRSFSARAPYPCRRPPPAKTLVETSPPPSAVTRADACRMTLDSAAIERLTTSHGHNRLPPCTRLTGQRARRAGGVARGVRPRSCERSRTDSVLRNAVLWGVPGSISRHTNFCLNPCSSHRPHGAARRLESIRPAASCRLTIRGDGP